MFPRRTVLRMLLQLVSVLTAWHFGPFARSAPLRMGRTVCSAVPAYARTCTCNCVRASGCIHTFALHACTWVGGAARESRERDPSIALSIRVQKKKDVLRVGESLCHSRQFLSHPPLGSAVEVPWRVSLTAKPSSRTSAVTAVACRVRAAVTRGAPSLSCTPLTLRVVSGTKVLLACSRELRRRSRARSRPKRRQAGLKRRQAGLKSERAGSPMIV